MKNKLQHSDAFKENRCTVYSIWTIIIPQMVLHFTSALDAILYELAV